MDITNRLTTVVGVSGVQAYLGQIRAMQGAVAGLKSELEQFGITGASVVQLTAGVGLLTAGFKLMGFAIREASKEMKYLRVMTYAFGSRQMAEAKMNEVGGLSTKYGLEKEVIAGTYARLGAFGVAPGALKSSTETMADIASATGNRDQMQMVMERLALIQEMGGISGRNMMSLAKAGVDIHQVVAAQLAREKGGTTEDWVAKLKKPTAPAIAGIDDPFAFVIKAFQNSKWKGIAVSEAQGFGGSMARIKLAMANFWDSTGEILIKALTPMLRVMASVAIAINALNDATGGKAGLLIIVGLLYSGFRLAYGAIARSIGAVIQLTASINAMAAAMYRASGATAVNAGASNAGAAIGLGTRASLAISSLPGAAWVARLLRPLMNAVGGLGIGRVLGGGLGMVGKLLGGTLKFFVSKIFLLFWAVVTAGEWLTGLAGAKFINGSGFWNKVVKFLRSFFVIIGDILNPLKWFDIIKGFMAGRGLGAYGKDLTSRIDMKDITEGPEGKANDHLANIDKNTQIMANSTVWGNKDWRVDNFQGSWLRRAERAQLANGRPG